MHVKKKKVKEIKTVNQAHTHADIHTDTVVKKKKSNKQLNNTRKDKKRHSRSASFAINLFRSLYVYRYIHIYNI